MGRIIYDRMSPWLQPWHLDSVPKGEKGTYEFACRGQDGRFLHYEEQNGGVALYTRGPRRAYPYKLLIGEGTVYTRVIRV